MSKDCVSLEVAQKLQKAGYKFKDENGFNPHYIRVLDDGSNEWTDQVREIMGHDHLPPAPTATQLAEELPLNILPKLIAKEMPNGSWCEIHKENGCWSVKYVGFNHVADSPFSIFPRIVADTLPDALGLMMVYLLENKLI